MLRIIAAGGLDLVKVTSLYNGCLGIINHWVVVKSTANTKIQLVKKVKRPSDDR